MDNSTLLGMLDFGRGRLLALLDTIETSGQDPAKVLAWRPGPGRAHIGWQFMHCAATHDRYFNQRILNKPAADESLVAHFAGGSTPADVFPYSIADIRAALAKHIEPLRAFIASATPADYAKKHTMPNGVERSIGESIQIIIWHEAHHQGQIHLTWNLYRAAHGLK